MADPASTDWEPVKPAGSAASSGDWESVDMPGSVFDKPSDPTKVRRAESKVTGISRAVVETAVPVAAGIAAGAMVGPEASAPVAGAVRTAGAAIGGLFAPYAGYISDRFFGEHPPVPTPREALHSAVVNAAWTGAGEVAGGLTKYAQVEDRVRAEVAKLPQAERTVGRIKQIRAALKTQAEKATSESENFTAQDLRNRDFWKRHGLNDQQIQQVVTSPELQTELARSIDRGRALTGAYQTVKTSTENSFKDRYKTVLGPFADVKTDSVPIGQQFESIAQSPGQHELTPTFRGFLQRKGLELTRAGETAGPSVGGVPWKALPETLKEQIRAQGGVQGIKAPVSEMSIQDVRDLRTELRENIPSSANNLDKQAYRQLKTALDAQEEKLLNGAGATPEQVGALKALDQEWGRFQETIKALDPRSEKFGNQVADAIFDPMAKDSGVAMNFIDLAQKADAVHPGVMGELREGFLDKALKETRVPGKPFEELTALRKLQDKWGGDKQARAVMGAVFGKDSPLAEPATFTRVVEAAAEPEPLILKANERVGYNFIRSPYVQGMIMFGAGAAAAGMKAHGLFAGLTGQQGLEGVSLAVVSLLAGPPMISWVTRSGNSPLQRAMVGFITNPNTATAIRYAGAVTGGIEGRRSTEGLTSEN